MAIAITTTLGAFVRAPIVQSISIDFVFSLRLLPLVIAHYSDSPQCTLVSDFSRQLTTYLSHKHNTELMAVDAAVLLIAHCCKRFGREFRVLPIDFHICSPFVIHSLSLSFSFSVSVGDVGLSHRVAHPIWVRSLAANTNTFDAAIIQYIFFFLYPLHSTFYGISTLVLHFYGKSPAPTRATYRK